MAVLTTDVAYVACGYRYWVQAMELAKRSCQRMMAGGVVDWCHFVRDIHTSLDRHNCSLMACLSKRPGMHAFAMKMRLMSYIFILG